MSKDIVRYVNKSHTVSSYDELGMVKEVVMKIEWVLLEMSFYNKNSFTYKWSGKGVMWYKWFSLVILKWKTK